MSPVSFLFAMQVANNLLSETQGQEALKAVYRFISYNSDWLQTALGASGTMTLGGQGHGRDRGRGQARGENGLNGNHLDNTLDLMGSFVDEEEEEAKARDSVQPSLRPWDEKTFREPTLEEMNTRIGERIEMNLRCASKRLGTGNCP